VAAQRPAEETGFTRGRCGPRSAPAQPPGAAARTTCSYAGAPRNVLTVTVKDAVGEIRRRGLEIAVRGQDEPLTRCTGGAPTVLNTDTIKVVLVDITVTSDENEAGPLFARGRAATTRSSAHRAQRSAGS